MKKTKKILLFWLLIYSNFVWLSLPNTPYVEASILDNELISVNDGYILNNTGVYSRFNTTNTIPIGRANTGTRYRGYVEYNISSLPNKTIQTIVLEYYCNGHVWDSRVYEMQFQPSITSNQTIYLDAANGTCYADPAGFPEVGYNDLVLNASAVTSLQNALTTGQTWWAIGLKNENETSGETRNFIYANESPLADSEPKLLIIYTDESTYQFTGEYYENGTFIGAETVTVSTTGTSEDITVDGTSTEYYSTRPTLITWLFGTTTRRYYIVSDTENITITEPDDTYSTYSFEFRDYAGLVGISDSYLEALRTINGTETIVERNIIYNTDTTTPLTLVQNRVYRLRIRLPDGTYYNLGYYTPGSTDPPTFSLTGLGFNDQYQPTSRWITQTSDRVNDTAIQYNYTSTVPGYSTLNVTVSLCYRNGTIIYTNSSVAETVSFTWNNLVNTTTYKVNSTITHEYYGILDDYSHLISGAFTPETFLSLDGLGIATDLLGAFLLICSAGITSRKFRAVGVAIMATFALVINYWGWLTVPYWLIGLVYAISGLMFLRGG